MYAKYDYEAQEYQLHYLRTKDGEEVDFALVNKDNIGKIIEVQTTNHKTTPALIKFQQKYQLPAALIVKNLRHEYILNNIEVLKVENFLKSLLL